MRHQSAPLSPTSYALLGQLALRPWSVYEMTKNIGRTLHWFWPRAESVIYAEMKRLGQQDFARTKSTPGRRGRPHTTYSITAKGRRALRDWLGSEPAGFSFHFEALLRVHLAPYGDREDLLRALRSARDEAAQLLRQATLIGTEFAEGTHQFQAQVHLRGILFDYLWCFGLTMYLWANHWLERVETWTSITSTPDTEREALQLIECHLAEMPRLANSQRPRGHQDARD